MKERVLVANRGEIALRIMEACENLGLDYVAVYTPGDEQSLHVKMPRAKGKPCFRISSYRDANDILAVADEAKCTAIHPGYGFFSEDFRFARRVVKRNNPLIFIGPRWEVIRDLGHKLNVKKLAYDLGIPVIPGTINPLYNELEAEAKAEELFLWQEEQGIEPPRILIKAAAGGGGMGIEEVDDLDMVRPVFRRIRAYRGFSATTAWSSRSSSAIIITWRSRSLATSLASWSILAPGIAPSRASGAKSASRSPRVSTPLIRNTPSTLRRFSTKSSNIP